MMSISPCRYMSYPICHYAVSYPVLPSRYPVTLPFLTQALPVYPHALISYVVVNNAWE